jgi:transcriptional regulator with XRE-family HTH domain
MTAAQFKAWRKALKLSQRAAAEEIGISPRQVWAYEHGEAEIPKPVAWACRGIWHKMAPWGERMD